MDSKLTRILEMIILIAAGFLVMLHPGGSMNVAVRILGIVLVAYGLIAAGGYFVKKTNHSASRLIAGVLSLIGGIVVLAGPQFVISVFPIVAGVVIALGGLRDLLDSLAMKRDGQAFWKIAMAFSLITIAFGILIFANPFGTMETVVTLLGIALLYNGVTGLFTIIKR